jgi:hypothetical protein
MFLPKKASAQCDDFATAAIAARVVPMFASTNIRKHEVQKKKAFVYEDL